VSIHAVQFGTQLFFGMHCNELYLPLFHFAASDCFLGPALITCMCLCVCKYVCVCVCVFFFVFYNIFVTGFPVKFGLLSPGKARQRLCRAYPGHWGNRTFLCVCMYVCVHVCVFKCVCVCVCLNGSICSVSRQFPSHPPPQRYL
jgi:hypothetical protein